MAFHYIRKFGSDGTLQRADGLESGLFVQHLQISNLLPLRVSLEILAFIADALNDALKNGFVHGDLKIDNICVTQNASVVINGYGRPRRNTFAPEGIPEFPSDIYGLGIIMLELLSNQRNIELPLEEQLHNQHVIEIFTSINWQEWADQPWLPNMQEFLISLLFFNKSDRPHPLDVANILSNSIPATSGPSLQEYIIENNFQFPTEEKLSQARSLQGTSMSAVDLVADSSQGMVTGFWTKDKIAEMFQDHVVEDEEVHQDWLPPEQNLKELNPSSGQTPSPFHSINSQNNQIPPPPSIDQLPPPNLPPPSMERERPPVHPPLNPPPTNNHPPPTLPTPPTNIPLVQEEESTHPPMIQQRPVISAGYQSIPMNNHHPIHPSLNRQESEPITQSNSLKFILIAGAVLVIMLMILLIASTFFSNASENPPVLAEQEDTKEEIDEVIEPIEKLAVPEAPKKKTVTKKKSTPKANTTKKKSPAKTNTTKPQKKTPAVTTTPLPLSADFEVQFTLRNQEATIACGVNNTTPQEFVNSIKLQFTSAQYCKITNDDGIMGTAYIKEAGLKKCKVNEDKITCR